MRSDRALLLVLLVIPLVVAFVGWPLFLRWVAAPPQQDATREVAGQPTSPPAPRPTTLPTQGAPTLVPRAVATGAAPTTPPAVAATARPVEQATGDPSATVSAFYDSIARRDYASAARLWSPRMQATFPPGENINQRFSQTQSLTVQRADVISQDPQNGNAAVAIDLVESAQDGVRHWVGTWYLVRGPDGWLLDQPQLANQ